MAEYEPWMRSILSRMKELYNKPNAKTIAEALPDGTIFTIKGVVANRYELPEYNNVPGDIYIVSGDGSEHIWLVTDAHPNGYWEKLGDTVNPEAVVLSVNGKTGAIVLNASDVNALPASTKIPSKTSDLQNDSGYITKAPVTSVNGKTGAIVLKASDVSGTYSKPSSGIPKSDLAEVVQTSLGKADTALQSSDLAQVATTGNYNDLSNKPAIPSLSGYATEAWVTDKGYQTAAQVQTAISKVRQLPAVSASDNDKFLRVVSGAWAAVIVPSAESTSF